MKKRWLAILMAVMMAISLLPTAAWAEETVDPGDVTPPTETASVLFVDPTSTSETPDGSESDPYPSLAAAFTAAAPGDTVKLLNDLEMTASVTIEKKVTLDLNGKTITVNIDTSEGSENAGTTVSAFVVKKDADFTVTTSVSGGQLTGKTAAVVFGDGLAKNESELQSNRAIFGEAGSKTTLRSITIKNFSAIQGKNMNGAGVYIDQGTLTINNCLFGGDRGTVDWMGKPQTVSYGNYSQSGGAIYTNHSDLVITNSQFYYNRSYAKINDYVGGGAVYADSGTVKISNTVFRSNQSWTDGGAISLNQVESATINQDCQFVYSSAHGQAKGNPDSGTGGAIYSRLPKNLTIEDCSFSQNYAFRLGGGIAVLGNDSANVLLSGNEIVKNDAGERGGGLYLKFAKNATISIPSGLIEENTAYEFGGGIAYTGHDMPTLELTNVLITGNEGARGGGIWACPTSETTSYSTLGGSIYGNTASGQVSNGIGVPKLNASGDDIRYEGTDTPDSFSLTLNPASPTTIMTVSKRALGGGLMKWYQDEVDARYSAAEAPEEANASLYTNTNKSFGLHGELSQDSQARAERHAKLIIKNNFCNGRGGGIATNSPIQIGLAGHDLDVVVEKKWTKEEHPDSATVTLVQVDQDKVAVELETVTLNAENGWTHTFCDLPGCYTDSNGELQDYTYTVKEAAIDGWVYSVKDVTDTHQQADDTTTPGTTTDTDATTGTEDTTEGDGSGDQTPAETPSTGKEPNKVIYLELTNSPKPSGGGGGGNNRPTLNTEDHFGYIIGYPVDYFTGEPTTDQTKKPVRPQGEITRAEVATIFFRMLTDESRTQYWSQSNDYSDVEQGQWFNAAVSTLSKAGIISGYPDGSFRPNGSITRAEFATIAVRFFDVQYDGAHLFPDIDGHWAQDYIDQAGSAGLVNGYPDGTFGPDRSITRAEAVTLVNRTLDRHPDPEHFLKDMLVWPDNMDTKAWYYADMQEATNSHQYEMKTDSDKTKHEVWTKMLPIRDWEAFEKAWSDAGSASNPGEVVNK